MKWWYNTDRNSRSHFQVVSLYSAIDGEDRAPGSQKDLDTLSGPGGDAAGALQSAVYTDKRCGRRLLCYCPRLLRHDAALLLRNITHVAC